MQLQYPFQTLAHCMNNYVVLVLMKITQGYLDTLNNQKHNMIRAALEASYLKRDLVLCMFHVEHDHHNICSPTIVFRKIHANQKLLNQIGKIFVILPMK